jgi:hypothetical protein
MEQNGPILLSLRYALSKLSVNLIEWESLLSKIHFAPSDILIYVPRTRMYEAVPTGERACQPVNIH